MTGSAAATDRRPGPDEVSLVVMANAVLRRRNIVAWTVLLLFVAAAVTGLLRARTYTSAATFIPQSGSRTSSLSGLAAQFGLAVPVGEATQSPDFYADLVRSREVLGTVLQDTFAFRREGAPFHGSLYQVFEIAVTDSLRRREEGIRALSKVVAASVNKRTGVVSLTATTRWPELSAQIARRVLDQVNAFNLQRRQSQANAEREFAERRLGEVRTDLRAAEDRLQSFLQNNRDYRNSPVLQFQYDRLSRDVSLKQEVYTTLAQAAEQATIEAVRDTPVITVVERPEQPARPDPRGLIRRGMLAIMLGLMLGVALAVVSDKLGSARLEEPGAYGELAALKRDLFYDLRRPWRLLRPRPRAG